MVLTKFIFLITAVQVKYKKTSSHYACSTFKQLFKAVRARNDIISLDTFETILETLEKLIDSKIDDKFVQMNDRLSQLEQRMTASYEVKQNFTPCKIL